MSTLWIVAAESRTSCKRCSSFRSRFTPSRRSRRKANQGLLPLTNLQRRRMMRATTSGTQTYLTLSLISAQPFAQRRPRDAKTPTHRARISQGAVRQNPATSPGFRTTSSSIKQRSSFTDAAAVAVGLWATRRVVHQIHRLPDQVK